VKRGEIWTLAGGVDYAGKPRPAVILQDHRFEATLSVTVCPFTTDPTEAAVLRLSMELNATNGLRTSCRLMVDKIVTVPRGKLGRKIGRLDDRDIVRLSRSIVVFLGLAG
jgi:mRNA interferase MazF